MSQSFKPRARVFRFEGSQHLARGAAHPGAAGTAPRRWGPLGCAALGAPRCLDPPCPPILGLLLPLLHGANQGQGRCPSRGGAALARDVPVPPTPWEQGTLVSVPQDGRAVVLVLPSPAPGHPTKRLSSPCRVPAPLTLLSHTPGSPCARPIGTARLGRAHGSFLHLAARARGVRALSW